MTFRLIRVILNMDRGRAIIMRALKKRLMLFICLSGFSVLVSVYFLLRRDLPIALVFTVLMTGTFSFSLHQLQQHKTAKLIIENLILYIRSAVIHENTSAGSFSFELKIIEVFISCFGILFDGRIIMFNQDGIQLKSVEVGQNDIYLTYGTDEQTRCVQLLHASLDKLVQQDISKKFYRETGMTVKIID